MNIYMVVPGFMLARKKLVAVPGWRVMVSLDRALVDLDVQYKQEMERRSTVANMYKRFHPVLVVAEIPIENIFSCCRCEAGSACTHDGWLRVDSLLQPTLLRDVSNWRPVTKEEVQALEIEERMLKIDRKHERSYRKEWFPRMPSENDPTPAILEAGNHGKGHHSHGKRSRNR